MLNFNHLLTQLQTNQLTTLDLSQSKKVDWATARKQITLSESQTSAYRLIQLSDGRLVSACQLIKFWDVISGECTATLDTAVDGYEHFSSLIQLTDGRLVSVSTDEQIFRLRNIDTGHSTTILTGHGPSFGYVSHPTC